MSSTDHETLRYAVFSIPLLPRPSYAQISSSAPYSLTPLAYIPLLMWETKFHTNAQQKTKLQFCMSRIFGQQNGKQKILHRMIASVSWLQSALNFFMNANLICSRCSKISELFHRFSGYVTCLYVVILSSILFTRHDHLLSFISICFLTNLLRGDLQCTGVLKAWELSFYYKKILYTVCMVFSWHVLNDCLKAGSYVNQNI
jgi:hypothetical protein